MQQSMFRQPCYLVVAPKSIVSEFFPRCQRERMHVLGSGKCSENCQKSQGTACAGKFKRSIRLTARVRDPLDFPGIPATFDGFRVLYFSHWKFSAYARLCVWECVSVYPCKGRSSAKNNTHKWAKPAWRRAFNQIKINCSSKRRTRPLFLFFAQLSENSIST